MNYGANGNSGSNGNANSSHLNDSEARTVKCYCKKDLPELIEDSVLSKVTVTKVDSQIQLKPEQKEFETLQNKLFNCILEVVFPIVEITEMKTLQNRVFDKILIQNFPILEILNSPECKRKGFKIISSDGKLIKPCSKGQIAT